MGLSVGYVTDDMTRDWLNIFLPRAKWASLHYEIPSYGDPGASEFSSPGYARVELPWAWESDRGVSIDSPLSVGPVTETVVAAIGFWTEANGGTLVGWALPDPEDPLVITDTGMVIVPQSELAVRFT